MNIKIRGGFSWTNCIVIFSNKYKSCATLEKLPNGEFRITNEVSKLPESLKYEKWIYPLILRYTLPLFLKLKALEKIVLMLGLSVNFFWTSKLTSHTPSSVTFFLGYIFPLSLIVLFMWFTHKYIAKFHAAEHMAIECYLSEKSCEPTDICKYSRISDLCGTRIFLGMIFASIIVQVALHTNGLKIHNWYSIATLEFVLLLEKFIGLQNIPVIREGNRLLQRFVLTVPPEEIHLEVASTSLRELIQAHKDEWQATEKFADEVAKTKAYPKALPAR